MADKSLQKTRDEWERICPHCGKEKRRVHDLCPECESKLCPRCEREFTDGALCTQCKSAENNPDRKNEAPAAAALGSPPGKTASAFPEWVRNFAVPLVLVAGVSGAFLWKNSQNDSQVAQVVPKQEPAEIQQQISPPASSAPHTTSPEKMPPPEPVPYRVCVFDDATTGTGIKRMRVVIATEERDMAKLSTKQLAATAYSAMDYFNDGQLRDYLLINVLLVESCASRFVTLARAQIGEGRRIVQASPDKAQGPAALAIRVAENIESLKGGQPRATTSGDYAVVGKKMKMSAEKVKELHFELTMHATLADFYDVVTGVPATSPVTKR